MTGSRYFRGFVGTKASHDRCLVEKVDGWTALVATLSGVARKHPQTPYAGLQKSLQQECAFMKRITPDIGMAFQPV